MADAVALRANWSVALPGLVFIVLGSFVTVKRDSKSKKERIGTGPV